MRNYLKFQIKINQNFDFLKKNKNIMKNKM